MDIKIKYNDEIDEFTWDLTLNMRIERYIKEHFYPYNIYLSTCLLSGWRSKRFNKC